MTQSASYKIIFEDEALIAVDKPSGLLVIETPKKEKNTLTRHMNDLLDSKGIKTNAYPCHRIDRETSGLILYAKGKSIQRLMMEEFKRRKVKKSYIAYIHGYPKNPSGTIKSYLYNKNKHRNELAITKYRVVRTSGHPADNRGSRRVARSFSVVEVEPVTGRTNQIRRHFSRLGHPLLGERVFAFARDYELKFRRVALHAKSLEFTHPVTKKRICLSADLPQDMESFHE